MWVTTEQEAYQRLLRGECVSGRRGIGKTTALLRVVNDLHDGRAVIVCLNQEHSHYVRGMWDVMFPGRGRPMCSCSEIPAGVPVTAFYADNWENFTEEKKAEIGPYLRAAVL